MIGSLRRDAGGCEEPKLKNVRLVPLVRALGRTPAFSSPTRSIVTLAVLKSAPKQPYELSPRRELRDMADCVLHEWLGPRGERLKFAQDPRTEKSGGWETDVLGHLSQHSEHQVKVAQAPARIDNLR